MNLSSVKLVHICGIVDVSSLSQDIEAILVQLEEDYSPPVLHQGCISVS